MAQQPFLKSIRPVNLLSFGPNTEEIELRPLNILIGANGSGKSNLIEIVGLLSKLPDKDPWSKVRETGGALEWIWKGKSADNNGPSLTFKASGQKYPIDKTSAIIDTDTWVEKTTEFTIALREQNGSFAILKELFQELDRWQGDPIDDTGWFDRNESVGHIHSKLLQPNSTDQFPSIPVGRSVFSMPGISNLNWYVHRIQKVADDLERFAFYRDWVFGAGFVARNPISAGQPVESLKEDASNLAQVLARYQSDFRPTFDRLNELMKQFYEPIKAVEVRIVSTHLQVAILEEGGFSIPAYRLSDGTLRWLALLSILLNPTPAPVTCIEEPELGLHPDMIPTLADLLRDASTRTQLIITTHSQSLVECFSDDPESVCVCEKVEGATQIRRLSREKLSSWLEDYSLGQLWAKGEIGGNRW
jgi:predicted ATPase